jgi:hypothetical protein
MGSPLIHVNPVSGGQMLPTDIFCFVCCVAAWRAPLAAAAAVLAATIWQRPTACTAALFCAHTPHKRRF